MIKELLSLIIINMTKFSEMKMFATIVKHNGLASAGREIGLSPAAITAKLKKLEEKLGVKLLNRSTRHIALTEAGELYYKASMNILSDIDEVENLVKSQSKDLKGSIKISAPKDVGKHYILPIINEFSCIYPEIKLYLYLNDKVTNIQESGMDIIIRYGELDDCNLISRRLAVSKRVLCVSPEYIAKNGEPLTPQELINHQCLVMINHNHKELNTWYFQKKSASKKESISIEPVKLSDDGEIIRLWALEGMGIALKSLIDIKQDIHRGKLTTILNNYMINFNASSEDTVNLNVVYLSRKFQPKRFELFLNFLFEKFDIFTY